MFVVLQALTFCGLWSTRAEENANLPVDIGIRNSPEGGIRLVLSNSSSKDVRISSNIESVLNHKFQDFPTSGTLQLTASNGTPLLLKGQNADGWWRPADFSSTLDPDADAQLQKMDDILVKAGDSRSFPLDCMDILKLAATDLADGQPHIGRIRIRIPITVSESGSPESDVVVTSDWMPVPDA